MEMLIPLTSVQIDRSWVAVIGGPVVGVQRWSLRNSVASGGRSVVVGHGSRSRFGVDVMQAQAQDRLSEVRVV